MKNHFRVADISELNFSKVVDVCLKKKTFIQHPVDENYYIDIIELGLQDFNINLFKYKQFLKSRGEPEDRVGIFECIVDGKDYFDLEKFNRILKSRLHQGETFEGI